MTSQTVGDFVHDPRHRYSWELRPDDELDHELRSLAADLEAAGLLATGAATAPRFHPHLTLLRADRADRVLLEQVAARIGHAPDLRLDVVGTFGSGRIAWLAPSDVSLLVATRSWLIDELGEQHVDPLALARNPWTPHVTVAYAVDEPQRDAVQVHLRRALSIRGRWSVAQCWDLDVRPTTLQHEVTIRG
jgi:2'-5' RNA ligase